MNVVAEAKNVECTPRIETYPLNTQRVTKCFFEQLLEELRSKAPGDRVVIQSGNGRFEIEVWTALVQLIRRHGPIVQILGQGPRHRIKLDETLVVDVDIVSRKDVLTLTIVALPSP